MKQPAYRENGQLGIYRGGNFEYTIEERDVLVHHVNRRDGLGDFVNIYHYPTYEKAERAAYKMAFQAANA